jgi:GT2 family glycosyltransferase
METSDPSGAGLLEPDESDQPDEPLPAAELPEADGSEEPRDPDEVPAGPATQAAPPVVAVLVTSDPGPWLEDALGSLAAQEYPALQVLVLDDGSTDDPTPRIAAAMPTAYVRRLGERLGYAAAANEAIATVEGATFLLFCHDDVVFEPDALGVMVEEAYRSNAGVVGPKLVDYDRPDVLVEVGMSIDHYGVPFSGIEPGELDQEQHDAVRDVFFVSTAAMLVRADLFAELGGFDAATFPGSDDLDLCWRARLVGARVLVAPDARVRHRRSTAREQRPSRNDPAGDIRARTRSRVRVLAKSYSGVALVWVLPLAFLLDVIEALALLVTRRAGRAAAVMGGWWSNIRQVGDVRRARRQTQALRQVGDADVRDLMVRGSARIRSFFTLRLHAGDRIADVSQRTRAAVGGAGVRLRRLDAVLAVTLGLLLFVGSRGLIFDRVPEVGTLRAWPDAGALWSAFFSTWRHTMLGADRPGPTAFGLSGALATLLLGNAALARTLVVVAAYPLGAFGAYRLVRPFARVPMPAVVGALAYGANPVARNAIAHGRLGSLVTYALAPFVLMALVRGSDAVETGPALVRRIAGLAIVLAVAASVWPPALLAAPAIAVAVVLAVPFSGGAGVAARAGRLALAATAAAFVLLGPWSFSMIGADAAALGLLPRDPLALRHVLQFQTGPTGSGVGGWGLLIAAVLPLAVATGNRLAWAGRAWILVALSFALAWLPGRVSATAPVPDPEGILVFAALGLAFAAGLGAAAFVEDLRTFHFGWRQLVASAAAVGIALPVLGLAADTTTGRWDLPAHDWPQELAWLADDADAGGFRLLWLGDATILPTGVEVASGVGYGLTSDGTGDARDLLPPGSDDATAIVAEALREASDGRTTRLGHLLAPAGVRYVALLRRAAPDGGARGRSLPGLERALADQLDLTRRSDADDQMGAVLYENEAWVATRALVPPAVDVPSDPADPLAAVDTTDLSGASAIIDDRVAGPGTVLDSQAADDGWRAELDGRRLERDDAFGWTNAFRPSGRGELSVRFEGGISHRVLGGAAVVLWLLLVGAWFRLRPARRPRRRAAS